LKEDFNLMDREEKMDKGQAVTRRRLLIGGGATAAGVVMGAGMGGTVFALGNGQPALGLMSGRSPITYTIAQEDGNGPINFTATRWGVYGADLGHTFVHRGRLYMVFGDTFGPNGSDWRSNTLARVIPTIGPQHGLFFDEMITDQPGHAKALMQAQAGEASLIPTYGVSVGSRMFLHYMSVNSWGAPGHWTLNYSGLAYSDDDGQNWTRDTDMTWPGDSNFGQVAILEYQGYLYFFGIPGGRYGGVQLARVKPQSILDKTAYAYWDGSSWQANNPAAAVTIVPAPVGELSVRWSPFYRKWLMMYLNDPGYRTVLRTADQFTGPWSEEKVILTGQDYPQLYAPYMLPLWNDGPDIYYTMSLFGPYCVYLMSTRF